MAVDINLPNESPPASHISLIASTYWIHQNGGTGGEPLIRFNKKGWQKLPKYVDLIVYDTSIDVEKGGTFETVITDLANLDRIGQLQVIAKD